MHRLGDMRYDSDFYNEWFISPDVMVTHQLQGWRADAVVFQNVLDTLGALGSTYFLEGVLIYADYRSNPSPKAVIEMQLALIKELPAREEIVFRREYQKVVDLADRSPDALANGWNDGLRQILAHFEEDLQRTGLAAFGPQQPFSCPAARSDLTLERGR